MKQKWILLLTGTLLSVMLMAGCNTNKNNDGNPPPPQNNMNPNNNVNPPRDNNNVNPNNNNNNNMPPGVDKNDNMFKDDEKDTDPDPEDLIEDPRDIRDKNNKDQ